LFLPFGKETPSSYRHPGQIFRSLNCQDAVDRAKTVAIVTVVIIRTTRSGKAIDIVVVEVVVAV
jgi:hypothetical protein